MKNHADRNEQTTRIGETAESGNGLRPYSPPALKRHEKLPVITAGSISKENWRFADEEETA